MQFLSSPLLLLVLILLILHPCRMSGQTRCARGDQQWLQLRLYVRRQHRRLWRRSEWARCSCEICLRRSSKTSGKGTDCKAGVCSGKVDFFKLFPVLTFLKQTRHPLELFCLWWVLFLHFVLIQVKFSSGGGTIMWQRGNGDILYVGKQPMKQVKQIWFQWRQ